MIKKFSQIIIIVFILGGCKNASDNNLEIYKTNEPLVIEGLNKDIWNKASSESLLYLAEFNDRIISNRLNESNLDFSANFKSLWDDSYLYLRFEVVDDFVFTEEVYPENPEKIEWVPWNSDAIELFFDMDDEKGHDFNVENNHFRYEFVYGYGVSSYTLSPLKGSNFSQ